MMKVFVTGAVISKGFDGAPALRFHENGGLVQFKIGKSVYDKNAENKKRYINIVVKAFGAVSERIEKMKLKEGSYINIIGRLDEDVWEDDGNKKSRFVIIVDEIEFSGGNGNSDGNGASSKNETTPPANRKQQNAQAAPNEMPSGFTGYRQFEDNDDLPF